MAYEKLQVQHLRCYSRMLPHSVICVPVRARWQRIVVRVQWMEESVSALIKRINSQGYHCLNISHRNLTVLPDGLRALSGLRQLLVNGNNLVSPPDEIMHLCNSLEELVLDGNNFTLLPSKIGEFVHLKRLSLSRTPLGAVCQDMMKLIKLQELWLCDCSLVSLPKEIGFLNALTVLGLRKNDLHRIPGEIADLKNLKWLCLAENNLENLPKKFSQLKNLRHADFAHNKFRTIPEPLLELPRLKVLLLPNNFIESVSDDILLSMANMVKVDLRENLMLKKPEHWKGMEFVLVCKNQSAALHKSEDNHL